MQKILLREMLNDFVSLFYPNVCLGCSGILLSSEQLLCTKCLSDLPYVDHADSEEYLKKVRFGGRLPLTHATALLTYSKKSKAQRILQSLKYKHHPELGYRLGRLIAERQLKWWHDTIDLAIPVPLHEKRRSERGYNQSMMVAQGIAEVLGVPCAELLKRVKETGTQTKKNRFLRWFNVSNAFYIDETNVVRGKRVLLVDDVITTGATIEACGQQLISAGCAELSLVCIAQA